MRIKIFCFILFLVLFKVSYTQDTIVVMNYNLLFYGYYTDFCTPDNNNVEAKAQNLHTIIDYFRPDIFTVNELGRNTSNTNPADHLLNNALNINDIDFYDRAGYTNTTNSGLVNMLYYNKNKFGLAYQSIPSNILRDINLYKLYYKSEDLEQTNDTTFVICIVSHLKAGSSSSDQQTRRNMVNAVMTYLDYHNYSGNIMFMGDFNVKSSFETSYQLMVNYPDNPDVRFNDPIDKPGQWYNNPDMALYHTQSPRTGSHPCFVTGGLDDRYDFILVSNDMLSGAKGLKYIEDSYYTIGQDGNRYNQSLVSPTNYSQPSEIINAMYNFSDHLPVKLKLEITEKITSISCNNFVTKNYFIVNNPVREHLEIVVNFDTHFQKEIKIVNTFGNEMLTKRINSSRMSINVSDLPVGLYFAIVTDVNKNKYVQKFIKL